MTSTLTTTPLRRALLHPMWLGAVALLALNDHVLKGAGVLPGVVTGKLSDVAGLFAAPLLLAVLLRVSSRRAWAAAHILIGLVFAAIQVSVPAADLWSSVMGLVGFPWAITSDPTDLLTLPALALSYRWVPRLAAGRAPHRGAGEVVVATAGVACCVATSPPVEGPFFGSFETDTYLHNGNDYDIVLRVRPLAESTALDCDVVEEDPARFLRDAVFADAQSWTLAPDATMPVLELWERPTRDCHAAWVDADNLAPSVVFWREGQVPVTFVEGQGITDEAPGWISVVFDDEGRGRYETEEELVFAIEALPPVQPGACTPSNAATRLAWGTPPAGLWRLGSSSEGPDGCVQVELRTGFEQQQDLDGTLWEVCLPPGAFPFDSGDLIELTSGNDSLSISRVHPDTGFVDTTLIASTNADDTVFGMQAIIDPEFDCEPIPEESCGTVRRAVSVSMVGGGFPSVPLRQDAEAPARTQTDDASLELYLVHASERVVTNAECEDILDPAATDLELVAIHRDLDGE